LTKTVFRLVEIISYEPCVHSIHCQLDPAINHKTYRFLRSYAKGFKVGTLPTCLKQEPAKISSANARMSLLTCGESHTVSRYHVSIGGEGLLMKPVICSA